MLAASVLFSIDANSIGDSQISCVCVCVNSLLTVLCSLMCFYTIPSKLDRSHERDLDPEVLS